MTPRVAAVGVIAASVMLFVAACGSSKDSRFQSVPIGDDLHQMLSDVAAVRGLPPPSDLRVGVVARKDGPALIQRALTSDDRATLAHTTTLYRLLGHLAPDEDYLTDYLAFIGNAFAGLYVPADKTLWLVRDAPLDLSQLSPVERATLAHELAHAIQDSNFDVAKRAAAVANDLDASLALTSVIEGDAVTNQDLYTATYGAVPNAVPFAGGVLLLLARAPVTVPASIERELRFPYTTGADWVNVLRQAKGTAPIDAILRGQPLSTAAILHPELFAQGRQPEAVTLPDIGKSLGRWEQESGGTWGEFGLYNYLQLKLPALTALSAAAGWAGDRYDVYVHGKDSVAVFRLQFTSAGEAQEFAAAQQTLLESSGAAFTTRDSVSIAALGDGRVVARSAQPGREVIFAIATNAATAETAVRAIAP